MKKGRLDLTVPFFISRDMIEAIILFIRILFFLSLLSLIMGFIRPVYVLWFMDRCNRLMVLKLYGTLSLVFFVLYTTLEQLT